MKGSVFGRHNQGLWFFSPLRSHFGHLCTEEIYLLDNDSSQIVRYECNWAIILALYSVNVR